MASKFYALLGALALSLLFGASLGLAAPAFVTAPPVGYDHPELDQGGPITPGGLQWIEEVSAPAMNLAPKLAGGKLRVVAFINGSGVMNMHELNRRFPMEMTVITPGMGPMHQFGDRALFDPFFALLKSGKRIDAFIFARVDVKTIPDDVMYEVLRRVRNDGTGMYVSDIFDWSDTFNFNFWGLKATVSNVRLIPGIPYDGLTKWESTKKQAFSGISPWNTYGEIYTTPKETPFSYYSTSYYPFGKGAVIYVETNSGHQRYYEARVLVPDIHQHPSSWSQVDYFYSHTAKALLFASGRARAATINSVTPSGAIKANEKPVVSLASNMGLTGKLRWEFRDSWGKTSAPGAQDVTIPPGGGAITLDAVTFNHGGKQFLNLWLENAAGETLDWAATFINVDRGVEQPQIALKYPEGTPRGENLQGTVTAKGAPADAKLSVKLIDRYWREVGAQVIPMENGAADFNLPAAGLDGQIWLLQVDVLNAQGAYLARAAGSITIPNTRETGPGYFPGIATAGNINPESAGIREYQRRLGFTGTRPFGAGSALQAEGWLWNDMQAAPYWIAISAANDDYANAQIKDWNDPAGRKDVADAVKLLAKEMKPFGLRGFNLTDDSMAGTEMTSSTYTLIEFHNWLKKQYGDFDAVCKAWGWTPAEEPLTADALPSDPYVTAEFHKWLLAKYKNFTDLSKAWGYPAYSYGSLHVMGAINGPIIPKMTADGKTKPAEDARLFMKEYLATNPKRDNFGRITKAAIAQANAEGKTAAWIDAQRFMQLSWVGDMEWVRTSAQEIDPTLAVGSNAAVYNIIRAECFGRLNYIAPYYDDLDVKVAISRGRARRSGDYGACVGTYGDKPANMSGRRGQIWDLLLAGSNSLYYWMTAGGLGLDLDINPQDAHSRFQFEAIEEIMRGPGELVTGSTRIFHPVAILESHSSSVCDQLEGKVEAITSVPSSMAAFQYAFEDIGINPHTITDDELASGWLADNKVKILALPGANSLSDKEIAAIRDFAQKGGVVIADSFPGMRLPNGNLRDQAPLADLFGVNYQLAGARRSRADMTAQIDNVTFNFGETLADPRVTAKGAKSIGTVGATPTLFSATFGAGKAYLFNASFGGYTTHRTNGESQWQAWSALFKQVAATVTPEFTCTSEGKVTPGFELSGFANGNGYLLGVEDLGCGDYLGIRRPIEITLPSAFHVYDVRAGKYLGSLEKITTDIPRSGHRLYSLLPYRVDGITAAPAAKSVSAGELINIVVDLQANPAAALDPHVIRLEACDPNDKPLFPYQRVLKMPVKGPLTIPLKTATNDARGTWTFCATDVNTGARTTFTVEVK